MERLRPEKEVLKSCCDRLDMWQMKKVVIHYDRNNSGKINTGRRWIKLHKEGTPDLTAFINYKGICVVYFIEVKRSNINISKGPKGKQLEFMMKFNYLSNVWYDIVNNPDQVDSRIDSLTNYFADSLDKLTI